MAKKRSHAWYERSNLFVYLISYKKVKKVWLTKKGIFQKYFCLSLINMPQESFMIFVASINIITGDSGLCRVVLVVHQPSGSTYWKEVDRANGLTNRLAFASCIIWKSAYQLCRDIQRSLKLDVLDISCLCRSYHLSGTINKSTQ